VRRRRFVVRELFVVFVVLVLVGFVGFVVRRRRRGFLLRLVLVRLGFSRLVLVRPVVRLVPVRATRG